MGEPPPEAVHWYTSAPTRHVLYRAEWGEATLRLDRLDRRDRRWIFDPGFIDLIGGPKPDDSLVEIDEDEALGIERRLLLAQP